MCFTGTRRLGTCCELGFTELAQFVLLCNVNAVNDSLYLSCFYRSVVKSRHLWKWSRQKDFVNDLCGTDEPLSSSSRSCTELKWSELRTLLNQRLPTKDTDRPITPL